MKTKYIFLLFLCLASAQLSFAQSNSKLFDRYADMDGVTSVYISKAMFQMMPNIETAGLKLANLKGKIESLQVLTTERKDLTEKMQEEFSRFVTKQHAELMRVRDEKTKATFYAHMQGERVKDLIMLANTEEGFTVIQLLGNFTLQDVQEITGAMSK
ncbi:DUF4252 domain-containing protein [Parabacteroides sp. 52]|uniref:DUF4252 domain-containing protein n=1 Tax=unclassified Parabacteroides TaxID=2649774 RepID=UPI0013D3AC6A|nr:MULTISPECIES: DUF4252 domain-containing protein [unclassified Parabacteroides]MDH6534761.1 hypothetical protein [Parabacteroides sp. PM5-20]NDV55767.1 DUF4252 domain-containing protein [Parabacteroides sp. 52]